MKAIYETIEEYVSDYDVVYRIQPIIRQAINSTENEETKEQLKLEYLVSGLTHNNGSLKFKLTGQYLDTTMVVTPNIEQFQKSKDYIINRFSETQNEELKILYGLILVELGLRQHQIVHQMIDCALILVDKLKGENLILYPEEYLNLALFHGITTKYQEKYLFEKLESVLTDDSRDFYGKKSVIDFLIKTDFMRKKQQISPIIDSSISQIHVSIRQLEKDILYDYFLKMAIRYFEATKNKPELERYSKELGVYLFDSAIRREEQESKEDAPSFLAAYGLMNECLKYAKRSNDKKFYEKVSLEYNRIGAKLRLTKFETKLNEKENRMVNEMINRVSEFILNLEPPNPFLYLSQDNEILRFDSTSKVKDSWMYLSNTYLVQHNTGNLTSTSTEEDLSRLQWFQAYSIFASISIVGTMHKVILSGYMRDVINPGKLMEFLANSWMGSKLPVRYGSNRSSETDYIRWVDLLAPGILSLFAEIDLALMQKDYGANFILSLDSLTTKIEGMLRHLAQIKNIPVTEVKGNKAQEVNLERLLNHEKVEEFLGKNDVNFFKYLFSSDYGLNIRNQLAHGLYRKKDYGLDKALLIVFAILRLSKFKVKSNTTL